MIESLKYTANQIIGHTYTSCKDDTQFSKCQS